MGRNISIGSQLPSFNSKVQLANKFKDFFVSKINNINRSFPLAVHSLSILPDFPTMPFTCFLPVSREKVSYYLQTMNKTFCQNDPIDLRLINISIAGDAVCDIWSEIINSSFQSGIFPKSEKFSIVQPLLKPNKDAEQLSSYRPLYRTSLLAKVLEYAALEQLKSYLSKFQYFSYYQSAYREYYSVETAMCKVYNDLVIKKSAGKTIILVLLDLSAAFDTVDHAILVDDLERIGIGGCAKKWFASYLLDRRFRVSIDDELSDEGIMISGVPQGSVLGPILFTIYTTELSYLLDTLGVSFHFYSDDSQLYFEVTNLNDDQLFINHMISKIKTWMDSRKLKLNVEKTEAILMGSELRLRTLNPQQGNVIINGMPISLAGNVRNLGVWLDQTLSLKDHLRCVKAKLINNIIIISRIVKFLDRSTIMKLVYGLILSRVDFCNALLYGLPECDLRGLQLAINSAARLVVGLPRFSREHITPVLKELHILPIKARIKYKICLLTHKALISGEPKYLASLLRYRQSLPSLRNTSVRLLEVPFISPLMSSDRCFAYCAPLLYNSLPPDIHSIDSLVVFKKHLKTFIFSETFD